MKKQKKDGVLIKKEAYLLNDISGQVMRCQIVAIMGSSGAGNAPFLMPWQVGLLKVVLKDLSQ